MSPLSDPTCTIPRPPLWTVSRAWLVVVLVAIVLALLPTGLLRQDLLNSGGIPQLWQFVSAAIHPDVSLDFLRITARAMLTTLAYAVCGTTVSVMIGLLFGILTSEVWWQTIAPQHSHWQELLRLVMRGIFAVPRAIHELIWGLFFVNIFGLDPLVAVLGIAVPYGAIVTKVFSELLDETPRQPLKALLSSGVSPLTAFLYTLLPQAFLDLLSYSFYRFECSMRSATVLGIIGAGGLGYEILLSLQSLRYAQLWTLFYGLFLLNGLVDMGSALLRRRLGSPTRLELNWRRSVAHSQGPSLSQTSLSQTSLSRIVIPLFPNSSATPNSLASPVKLLWHHTPAIALVTFLVMIPASVWYIRPDIGKLWSPRTASLLTDVVRSSLPVSITSEMARQFVSLSLQTLAMGVLAIGIASIGGICLSFLAAHTLWLPGGLFSNSQHSWQTATRAWLGLLLTRGVLLISRSIPAPIWALVVMFVVFPGILPGAIALGLHNMGILGRLMAETIENLDPRPILALKIQGSPAPSVFLYGLFPLTLTRYLAYSLYRWEVCMRETVIVGLVGAGGLGRLLTEQLSSFDYRGVLLTLGCFILLTTLVDAVSGWARRSLR